MSKSSDKPYKARVDLNKLKRGNIMLDADQIDQIAAEIRNMLNGEVAEDGVKHEAPMHDSIGYGVLLLTGTGRSEHGFQERVNAAATSALVKVLA